MTSLSKKKLNKNWIVDIDQQGITKSCRVPLGDSAKIWVDVKMIDGDGKPATIFKFYYKW